MNGPVGAWLVDLAMAGAGLRTRHERETWLSPDEATRAAAITDALVRAEWQQARVALRLLLARRVGAEAARHPFARGPHGKPVLAGHGCDFSLAHIEGLALIAITTQGAIGIDLERARPLRMTEPRRLGLEALAAALAPEVPLPELVPGAAPGLIRFTQAWTRIEAVAKATGEGVASLLGRLDFRRAPPASPAAVSALASRAAQLLADADLVVVDLQVGDGLAAAAAIPRETTLALARELPSGILAQS